MIRRFLIIFLFLAFIITPIFTLAQGAVEIEFAHSMPETLGYDSKIKAVIYVYSLSSEPNEAVTVQTVLTGSITGATIVEGKKYVIQPAEYKEKYRVKINFGEGDDEGIKDGEVGTLTFSGSGIVSKTYIISNIATKEANANINIDNFTINSDFPGTNLKINDILSEGINLFLVVIALVAFASLIYSGFLYITASGDVTQTAKANKNILWALIAIVLALSSYVIIRIVVDIPGPSDEVNKQSETTQNESTVNDKSDPLRSDDNIESNTSGNNNDGSDDPLR